MLSICNSLFEITTNVLSVVQLDSRANYSLVDIGFSTIVGSGMVQFTIVLFALRFIIGRDLKLDTTQVLRDLVF